MFSKKLVFAAILAFCLVPIFGIFAIADSEIEPEADPSGTWLVHVEWRNPVIIGDFYMDVTMFSKFRGKVEAEGHTGDFLYLKIFAKWDFDDIAYYKGIMTDTSGFGSMENTTGNYGKWSATKVATKTDAIVSPEVILGMK